MPVKYSDSRIVDEAGQVYLTRVEYMNWNHSGRNPLTGKLDLRALPLEHTRDSVMSHWRKPTTTSSGDTRSWAPPSANSAQRLPPDFSWGPLDSAAYSKFNGKLRKGSASMGVTLASWKQSRDMIVNRSSHLSKTLDASISRLRGDKGAREKLRRNRQPTASQVLEVEFGWMPLFQDFKAALTTVCKDGIPPEWVTSRARSSIMWSQSGTESNPRIRESMDGTVWVTYSAKVQISNPNLWLLNRLGLINPATIVWDLIPWSFVVNMFLNVNAMISSITDEVGLDITNRSLTRGSLVGHETLQYSEPYDGQPLGWPGPSFSRILNKSRYRTVGTSPKLEWQVKVPELNWELALIASSLVVQRFQTINKLIRVI